MKDILQLLLSADQERYKTFCETLVQLRQMELAHQAQTKITEEFAQTLVGRNDDDLSDLALIATMNKSIDAKDE